MIIRGRIAELFRHVSRRLRLPARSDDRGEAHGPLTETKASTQPNAQQNADANEQPNEQPNARSSARPSMRAKTRASMHSNAAYTHRRANELDEPAAIETLLRRHVRDGMNCVDVGAHIGGLTPLLTSLSQRGKHVAIEPVPFNARWLKENYPQVEVVECAVADAPGRATFFRGERAYEVDVRRLDDVVPSARTIELLKLAAEGGELEAFRGAVRILRRDRPLILFECSLHCASAFQNTAADVYAFLARHRYAIYTPVDLITGRGPLDEPSFERAVRFPFRAFHFVGLPADPPVTVDRDAPGLSYARALSSMVASSMSAPTANASSMSGSPRSRVSVW